jgi:hypothetical protein
MQSLKNRSPVGPLPDNREKNRETGRFERYFPPFQPDKHQIVQWVAELFVDRNNREPNRAYQGGSQADQRFEEPNRLGWLRVVNSIRRPDSTLS